MKTLSQKRIGEILILSQVALYGLSPIIIHDAVKGISPLLFLGLSTFTSAIILLPMLATKERKKMLNKTVLKYISVNTLTNIILAPSLIYLGTQYTSGTNTALLLQSEVFFTFLICSIFFNEKVTAKRVLGALIILTGTTTIMYDGSFNLNKGDLLIILATSVFPIGNIYCKKALKLVDSKTVVFLRSLIGGPIILLAFFLINQFSSPVLIAAPPSISEQISNNLGYILLNGTILLVLAKIMWFEGLKRIDISKAVTIGISYPAFGVIYAMLLLKESPSIYQILGFIIISIGMIFILHKKPNRQDIETIDPLN